MNDDKSFYLWLSICTKLALFYFNISLISLFACRIEVSNIFKHFDCGKNGLRMSQIELNFLLEISFCDSVSVAGPMEVYCRGRG